MANKKGKTMDENTMTTLEKNGAGKTEISESVIETIAGIAAREVPGVHELGRGGLGRVAKAFGSGSPARGVDVEVGTTEVAIKIDLIVQYGHNIQEVCAAVRQTISAQVKKMTGLTVKELDISVVDIHFPEAATEAPEPRLK